MFDLFGDTVTSPTTAPKSLFNAAHGFVEFWKTWPAGPRKVAKQQCLDKWARLGCCDCATLIAMHVEWLKTQDDWMRGFVCAPLVYLNQQRWIDWEPPAPKKPDKELAKMAAHDKVFVPPPAHIRAKIKQLTGAKEINNGSR